MPRYAAFLRGVSPLNCKMPELKKCFEKAGFTDVQTVLATGNVVFSSPSKSETALEKKIHAAMGIHLDFVFNTSVRSISYLQELLESDPFKDFKLPSGSKRVVTFFKTAQQTKLKLPIEKQTARILRVDEREAFTAYVPTPNNPAFMVLIEKTFGKDITTRTWETLQKVSKK